MDRIIKKIAVLGSGTMGTQIACHFANIGAEVLLLDRVPPEFTEEDKNNGLKEDSTSFRSKFAINNLKKAVKTQPSPLFTSDFASRIKPGNFEDDLDKIAACDWVLEAIIEKPEPKRKLYEEVEKYRKNGTLITSNTSGIAISKLSEGRSEDFQKHFCGTHFFNPPRYLQLLEIIPGTKTSEDVIQFLQSFAEIHLGKTAITCKDTPAFIGNRIGVYAIMLTIQLMQKMNLSIEQVDELTGKAVGRPKTATFRTADLVGLDVLADVSHGLYENLKNDEERAVFKLPDFMRKMLENGWIGDKVNQGFYKKEKEGGDTKLYTLDPAKMEYRPKENPSYLIVEEQKKQESLEDQFKSMEAGKVEETNFLKKIYLKVTGSDNDKAVMFFKEFYYRLFAYCSNRVPEITEEIYKIDEAIKAGFGWEAGPFEIWDSLGLEETTKKMNMAGYKPAGWVAEMIQKGHSSFYSHHNGRKNYYHLQTEEKLPVPLARRLIILENFREDNTIWQNAGCNVIDVGDGVLVVEFTSRMNTINMEVMEGINKAIDLAENDPRFKAVVIGNDTDDFSLGADLGMIGKNAVVRNKSTIEDALHEFQDLMLRIRYSYIPVIAAPKGKTLGGGCELCLYTDRVQAAAETYMGLVEIGVGLIPAGGGTTEMVRRASAEMVDEAPDSPHLQSYLMNISTAKVSTSAEEAFQVKYLRRGVDRVSMNKKRVLTDAKHLALELAENYRPPVKTKSINALGKNALSFYLSGIANMHTGNYMTDYDREIVEKLAYTMCGGSLSGKNTVEEEYMMRLERESFLELVTNMKTIERMGSMLLKGKPKRN
ncbi:3-hydroxyacyl-CoA dehydrogenase [Marivirga lumbricoides]|uniref:3-hydroxyacyl-CoA dehydrogenase n=1 Tax=Marivirga lumbricoides TaxID=1046115 RepID=A0ABQ1LZG7_9BACT|nr:3-hydroxyacyl-CoA dehydrogenase [Marivirga lumbricoides]